MSKKVQETRCAECGTWCQGFEGSDGKIYCADCYYKKFGVHPWDD